MFDLPAELAAIRPEVDAAMAIGALADGVVAISSEATSTPARCC